MNIHQDARLTPIRREEMCRLVTEKGLRKSQVALQFGVSIKTVSRWVNRFLSHGCAGMQDRSSRPDISPARIAQPLERAII
jgi:transposase